MTVSTTRQKVELILRYIAGASIELEANLSPLASQIRANLLAAGVLDKSESHNLAESNDFSGEKYLQPTYLSHRSTALMLEVTRRCQLHCVHCYANAGKQLNRELPLSTLIQLVDELPSLGWNPESARIELIGGEPLLRTDIKKLVAEICQRGYSIRLFTNGLLLNTNDIYWLQKPLIEVSISIDGTEKTHDALRGKGTYEKALNAIKLLVRNGVRTRLNYCAHSHNLKDIETLLAVAVEVGVHAINFDELLLVGRAASNSLNHAPRRKLYRALFKAACRDYRIELLLKSSHFARTVNQIRNGWRREYTGTVLGASLYVASNGDVYGGVDAINAPELCIGNVCKDPLSKIYSRTLNSTKFAPIAIDCLNKSCANCPVRYYCGGDYRGENFFQTGSLNSKHIKCEQIADSIINLMWMLTEKPEFLLPR
jgi:radical SAM protein with 4Fe4S-binding SPASM domain